MATLNRKPKTPANPRKRWIDAAAGRAACDLILSGVTYLDVFACRWWTGDVSIVDGAIVALEPGLKARRTIDARGKYLVPGFIDSHVHIESSLMTPDHFEAAVLARGTTTAFCDPHELANVIGVAGIRYFLKAAEKLNLDLRVLLSSCVPAASGLETNGAGTIRARDLAPLLAHPKAMGLAEMMNWPGVVEADPEVLAKLTLAHKAGLRVDGHLPLVRGRALSACAAAGISSCHESSELDEAREKLAKGIAVWIREGSVARDLDALAPLVDAASSAYVGFCTDDRNPYDIATEGHVDHLVRAAIRKGVPQEAAYRAASLSPARHYGLTGVGAIAPGYRADLVLLDDPGECRIARVFKSGIPVEELETAKMTGGRGSNTIRARMPLETELRGPTGNVHVIDVTPGRILTGRSVDRHDAPGVCRLAVLERHGHGSKPATGYVRGFGPGFKGAIASSVGHDSHNLIVAGSSERDMRVALAALAQSRGGFCVVRDGAVVAGLALPFGGLMSEQGPGALERSIRGLREASRGLGCDLPEPFLQLAFLSLPVIPSLKLTDKGLVDVEARRLIPVRAT